MASEVKSMLVQLGVGFSFVCIVGGCQPSPNVQAMIPGDAPSHQAANDDAVGPAVTPPASESAPPPASPPADAGKEAGIGCRIRPDDLALPHDRGRCDATSCSTANGSCVWGGFGCNIICARSMADEGKPCTDRADCQGFCATTKDVRKGAKASGTCSKTTVSMGCWNQVLRGVAQGYICRD